MNVSKFVFQHWLCLFASCRPPCCSRRANVARSCTFLCFGSGDGHCPGRRERWGACGHNSRCHTRYPFCIIFMKALRSLLMLSDEYVCRWNCSVPLVNDVKSKNALSSISEHVWSWGNSFPWQLWRVMFTWQPEVAQLIWTNKITL